MPAQQEKGVKLWAENLKTKSSYSTVYFDFLYKIYLFRTMSNYSTLNLLKVRIIVP